VECRYGQAWPCGVISCLHCVEKCLFYGEARQDMVVENGLWRVLGSSKIAFALSVTPSILLAWLLPFVLVLRGISQRPVNVHHGALSTGSAVAIIGVVLAS
jgi:hypothetical protein